MNKQKYIRDFLKGLQEGFFEDEGKKYTLKELRIKYDYEIQENVIPEYESSKEVFQ